MDIFIAKHLYDTQIKKLMSKNESSKFIIEKLEDANSDTSNTGGSNTSSISSCIISILIMVAAGYLSWNYISRSKSIEIGMKVIYTISAINCGSCFLLGYCCFANKK